VQYIANARDPEDEPNAASTAARTASLKLSGFTTVLPSMKGPGDMQTRCCTLCGYGRTIERSGYKAPDDRSGRMVAFPSVECLDCGVVQPDTGKILAMPADAVPRSVRMRCLFKSGGAPSLTTRSRTIH
jgi:hypothetical protein